VHPISSCSPISIWILLKYFQFRFHWLLFSIIICSHLSIPQSLNTLTSGFIKLGLFYLWWIYLWWIYLGELCAVLAFAIFPVFFPYSLAMVALKYWRLDPPCFCPSVVCGEVVVVTAVWLTTDVVLWAKFFCLNIFYIKVAFIFSWMKSSYCIANAFYI